MKPTKSISVFKKFRLSGFLLTYAVIFLFNVGCTTVNEPIAGTDITDVDGNVYHTIVFGTQTWTIENLKTTHFNDTTSISLVTDSTAWANSSQSAYCWYNNDSTTNKSVYGALYNWYAVNSGKLAPKGWHIPTEADWFILENYVSQFYSVTSSLSKILASSTHWASSINVNTVGYDFKKNNISGFAALPGGQKINNNYIFSRMDSTGAWWSSTQKSDTTAMTIALQYNQSNIEVNNYKKQSGLSVRCVKDAN